MSSTRINRMSRNDEIVGTHTNLNFHIGRLTLTGLSRINQESVVEAMQRKLSVLATQMPDFNWNQILAPLKINGGEISSDATSEQLGDHLATQIMQHLGNIKTTQDQR